MAKRRNTSIQREGEPDEKVTRVHLGTYKFKKKGISRFDLRDPYHLATALTWPQFLVALALYLSVNAETRDNAAEDIRFGRRYADARADDGTPVLDLTKIGALEPDVGDGQEQGWTEREEERVS